MLRKIIFTSLVFSSLFACSETISLPERRHGSVQIDFSLPKVEHEQEVTFSWVNSNPTVPAISVDWYPDEWYVRYHAPLTRPENKLHWTYKGYDLHRALAVAHFANGESVQYRFVVIVKKPEPVTACVVEQNACQDYSETK